MDTIRGLIAEHIDTIKATALQRTARDVYKNAILGFMEKVTREVDICKAKVQGIAIDIQITADIYADNFM